MMDVLGRFKAHPMVFYQFAPNLSGNAKAIDLLLDALHGTLRDSLYHQLVHGQEVTSYELYAENQRASYFLGLPAVYADFLLDAFKHAYKGSGFQQVERPIGPFSVGSTAVARLTLSRHPFHALAMDAGSRLTSALLRVCDSLSREERLWVQVLLQPLDSTWQDDFFEAYQRYLEGEEVTNGVGVGLLLAKGIRALSDVPRSMMTDALGVDEDKKKKARVRQLKLTERKLQRPGFRVCVRLAASSPNALRRQSLLSSLTNAFRTTNADNEWKLAGVWRKEAFLRQMQERRMPPFDNSVILCDEEVKAFFLMPGDEEEIASLTQMKPEETRVDPRITKGGIHIGYTVEFGKQGVPVYIPVSENDDAAKVRLWIGPPGAGKSTQAEVFCNGAARLGHGFAAYDAKDGLLFRRLLSVLSRDIDERRFVILDYENEERPPVFNFNALGGEAKTAGAMFVELFEILFNGQHLTTSKSFAVKCAHSVFSDPTSTFLEFIRIMRDEDFRKQFLPKLKARNPDLYLWWKREFPRISEGELQRMVQPILDRMENDVLYNTRMANILCGRGGRINYEKWMNEGKIVLVNIPLGHFTEPELRFLMALHNFASWNAILKRRRITQAGKKPRPFHLVFDEPQLYMDATPTIQTAIAKARAYGVSYNFFIQEAEQVIERSPSLWRCILGMAPMLMVGPVSEYTAKQLQAELGVPFSEILKLKELPYHWWYKGYAGKAAVKPIIIKSLPPLHETTDRTRLYRELVCLYGPYTAKQIQEDISARNYNLTVQEYKKMLAAYENEEEEGVEWDDEAETSEKTLAR